MQFLKDLRAPISSPPRYVRVSEFTATVLVMWVIYGLVLLVGGFFPDWPPSASLGQLPAFLEWGVGGAIFLGGVLTLLGAIPAHKLESKRWELEIPGLLVGGVGWLCLAIAALLIAPALPLVYIVSGHLTVAAFWRAWRVSLVAMNTRKIAALPDGE